MRIGEAAAATGVSAKLIRHYEQIGLIGKTRRTAANYREVDERDLHRLRFIRQARLLGFSLERIRELLSLWQDTHRASKDVKTIAMAHVAELDRRIVEMMAMRDTLRHLAEHCAGDDRPDCPILAGLEGEGETHPACHPASPVGA